MVRYETDFSFKPNLSKIIDWKQKKRENTNGIEDWNGNGHILLQRSIKKESKNGRSKVGRGNIIWIKFPCNFISCCVINEEVVNWKSGLMIM